MNWIICSVLLIISSIIVYLLIRESQARKIPLILRNLTMFLIPTILLFVWMCFEEISLLIDFKQIIYLFLVALLLSYSGSILSLKSLELAPNPGLSLIISKSYVVLTTILAIIFLDSEITLTATLGILVVVISLSYIIFIDKKISTQQEANSLWWIYALISNFILALLAIFLTYFIKIGVNNLVVLFYILFFGTCFILIELFTKKQTQTVFTKLKDNWKLVLSIGVVNFFFNYFIIEGYLLAPNPGYINTANAASIVFLSIASAIIFKDKFGWKQFAGVATCTFGLYLVFI